jgi:hypothetical protein
VPSWPVRTLRQAKISNADADSFLDVADGVCGAAGLAARIIIAMHPRVFLSHSRKDVAAVNLIKGQAMAAGVEVYLAEHDMRPGDSLADKIVSRIAMSNAVVVLLSDNSATAAFVQQEIGVALNAGIPIIPLVQKDLDHIHLAMLQGVEYVEFDPDHPEAALQGLTASLTRLTERIRQEEADQQAAKARIDALLLVGVIVLILIISASSAEG